MLVDLGRPGSPPGHPGVARDTIKDTWTNSYVLFFFECFIFLSNDCELGIRRVVGREIAGTVSCALRADALGPCWWFLRGHSVFFASPNFLIITITHVRKTFGCDPVVVLKVAVIIFSSSSATNTSKS